LAINNLVTVRRRIIIDHIGQYERKLTDELTLYNDDSKEGSWVILTRDEFLLGLTIEDHAGNRLAFHTNDYTKLFFEDMVKTFPNDNTEASDLLDSMKNTLNRKYVIFVELSNPVPAGKLVTIRLMYTDKKGPEELSIEDARKYLGFSESFLFTIPQFSLYNRRDETDSYEFFYIIRIPEGYKIEYDLNFRKVIQNKGYEEINEYEIDKKELKIYENKYTNIISIRVNTETNMNLKLFLNYYVIPVKKEMQFFTYAFFSIIGLSVIFTLIGLIHPIEHIIEIDVHNQFLSKLFLPILTNINALYGGIITSSLVIIGFMNKSFTQRTRYYFIIPLVISAIGFIFQEF
jgi:hypothetical protein